MRATPPAPASVPLNRNRIQQQLRNQAEAERGVRIHESNPFRVRQLCEFQHRNVYIRCWDYPEM